MSEPFWHYTDAQGVEHGPLPAEAVRGAIAAGQTGPSSLFWREGLSAWIALAAASAELGIAAKPPLPPDPYAAPRAATADPGAGPNGEVVYAGFLRRFAARFLDGLVLGVPLTVLMFAASVGVGATAGSGGSTDAFVLLAYLASFAVHGVYFSAMHSSSWQASLGKRAMGIKVTDEHGGRLGFVQALGRWFAAALSYLTVYVGFLMAAVTERKRALHDMVAGTLVVDRWAYTDHPERQQREASGCLIAAVICLVLMLFIVPILAAISISQYQDYVIRSQVAEGSYLADGAKTAVAEFYNNTGHFPPTNASAGLAASTEIQGKYVSQLDVSGGPIRVTFSSSGAQNANVAIDGAILEFSPIANGSSISWECGNAATSPVLIQDKWLPSACRH